MQRHHHIASFSAHPFRAPHFALRCPFAARRFAVCLCSPIIKLACRAPAADPLSLPPPTIDLQLAAGVRPDRTGPRTRENNNGILPPSSSRLLLPPSQSLPSERKKKAGSASSLSVANITQTHSSTPGGERRRIKESTLPSTSSSSTADLIATQLWGPLSSVIAKAKWGWSQSSTKTSELRGRVWTDEEVKKGIFASRNSLNTAKRRIL